MLLKIIAFVIGFAVVAVLEVALLSIIHGMPRGLGWVAIPVMAGIGLAGAGPDLVEKFFNSKDSLWRMSHHVRLASVLSAIWFIAVPAYWWLFEPFDGSRMYSDDYALMFKVMFFPIILLIGGYIAYLRFVVGATRSSEER